MPHFIHAVPNRSVFSDIAVRLADDRSCPIDCWWIGWLAPCYVPWRSHDFATLYHLTDPSCCFFFLSNFAWQVISWRNLGGEERWLMAHDAISWIHIFASIMHESDVMRGVGTAHDVGAVREQRYTSVASIVPFSGPRQGRSRWWKNHLGKENSENH